MIQYPHYVSTTQHAAASFLHPRHVSDVWQLIQLLLTLLFFLTEDGFKGLLLQPLSLSKRSFTECLLFKRNCNGGIRKSSYITYMSASFLAVCPRHHKKCRDPRQKLRYNNTFKQDPAFCRSPAASLMVSGCWCCPARRLSITQIRVSSKRSVAYRTSFVRSGDVVWCVKHSSYRPRLPAPAHWTMNSCSQSSSPPDQLF